MFILSQDKKSFAEYKKIYVSNQYNGKKNRKAFLLGVGTGLVVFSEGAVVLGEYETQEEAIAELNHICIEMSNGAATYSIRR